MTERRQFKQNLRSHFQYRNTHGAPEDIQADALLLFTPEVNKIEKSWTWDDGSFSESGSNERGDLATIASLNWSPTSEDSCATLNILGEWINDTAEPEKESYSANTILSSSIVVNDYLTDVDSSVDNNEWLQSYSNHTEPSIQNNFVDTACFMPHSNVEVETKLDSRGEFLVPKNLTNYRESTNQDIHTVTAIQRQQQAFESEQQFQDNPLDLLLPKLFALRDKLYTCSDDRELLRDVSELDALISEYKTNTPNIEHSETHLAVTVLVTNITELCSRAIDFNKKLFNMHYKISQELLNLHTTYAMSLESSYTDDVERMHSTTSNTIRSDTQSLLVNGGKTSRQETDPRAAFLFIKFLFDNDFNKPTKSQIRNLAKWTSITEREVDRWFIRTRANYVKSNKDPHKELLTRAMRLRRQFRGPLSELMKPNSYVIKKSFASRKLRRESQKVI
ncbi:7369_t:CDS:1 [Paraglomus brasilianum]|uniref:7369_t:CDS:1 n=1 Tax=Paraglomus brasilianum TaxID=144538 RepID=A0A9N9CJ68_9GLOM|nr:7369_t:CDS:1 [Paraglomus brasilianum]